MRKLSRIIAALTVSVMSSTAIAGNVPEVVFEVPTKPIGDHHLGDIIHHNMIQYGLDNEEVRLNTPHGEIIVRINRTWNKDCNNNLCPDSITVLSVPTNTVAFPLSITTPEGTKGTIKFFRFIGG